MEEYIEVQPTSEITTFLPEFELSQLLPYIVYIVKRYCDRLHLHLEDIIISKSQNVRLDIKLYSSLYEYKVVEKNQEENKIDTDEGHVIVESDNPYDNKQDDKHPAFRRLSIVYNITHAFTPQIQVYDDDISVRNNLVRYSNFVWSLTGGYKSTNMICIIAAMTNSMKYTLTQLIGKEPKCDFPEIAHHLNNGNLEEVYDKEDLENMNEFLLAALQNIKDMLIIYDNEFATWAGAYGRSSGTKRVYQGISSILVDNAKWVCNLFIPRFYPILAEELISIWLTALEGETDIWKKRLRLIEHLVSPIVEQLITIALPMPSHTKSSKLKMSTAVNLVEHWYQTGLFIHNTISNPLGMAALRTRTTLKGAGGFKDLPFDLRLVDSKLLDLKLCPIDTGDRENAGAIHYYTETELRELLFEFPYTNFLYSLGGSLQRPIELDKIQTYVSEEMYMLLKMANDIYYEKNKIFNIHTKEIEELIKDETYYPTSWRVL